MCWKLCLEISLASLWLLPQSEFSCIGVCSVMFVISDRHTTLEEFPRWSLIFLLISSYRLVYVNQAFCTIHIQTWRMGLLWLDKVSLNGVIDWVGRRMVVRRPLKRDLPSPPRPVSESEPMVNHRLCWRQHRSPLTTLHQQVDEHRINTRADREQL